ncbi:MAG: outer membrane lipoprotein carrier protein LolA [Acidobacteria bacterium]|nr:outer membrane lipoprotein carrier protein LolA [Acidobacteriota bacterium]
MGDPWTSPRRSWTAIPKLLPVLLCLQCSCAMAAATQEEILARMEAAGRRVTNFTAAISQKKWTAVLKEFDRGETGTLWYLRGKEGQASLRREIVNPNDNVLVVSNGEAVFYEPRLKQARKYQLGKNKDKAEFLVLGFGSSTASLSATYHIRLLGQETLDGQRTHLLELHPKSEKAAAYFSQILLWVAEEIWLPVQQKLVEPNGDYLLIKFSSLKLNPGIDKGKFKLTLPKDVQVG